MITTTSINDKIEVINSGEFSIVQVRKAKIIVEDGVEISRVFHRHTVKPTDDLSAQDADVRAVCEALFTDSMKATYQSYVDSLEV